MKKIAIITGASSGIGKEFAMTIEKSGMKFDEIWVVARRKGRLDELKLAFPHRPIALDLTNRESFGVLKNMLESEQVTVGLLINASGFGKFSATMESSVETNLNMVDLNCQAVMALCQICIPYMEKGSKIINIASVAGQQPIPYINVYAATKAFVISFSRALNREMKSKGISVMAVCPFWTKTEFFETAIENEENKVVKKYVAMYAPSQSVNLAWKDLKKGKDVSQYGFISKSQTVLAKLLPHSFVMSYWMNQQKLK